MRSRAAAILVALSSSCVVLQSCGLFGPDETEPVGVEIRTQSLKGYLAFPVNYDSTATYPLLVGLHGNGGSAAEFAGAFSTFGEESLVVAVAQGEYAKSGGGYSWFYLTEDRSLWEAYDTRSVNTLVELIGAIRARYRIGKVFVLGFSQGVSLAYMTGLRNPSLVSGVLAISGYVPEIDQVGSVVHAQDVAAGSGVKLFIARGFSDAVVPREVFTAQRDFFTANGYDVTAREYPGGHYITDDLQVEIRVWLRQAARQPAGPVRNLPPASSRGAASIPPPHPRAPAPPR